MVTTLQVRMDQSLKQEAESVFQEIGVDATTAVRMFYHKVISTRSIPFELKADKAERDAARASLEARLLAGVDSPDVPFDGGWSDRVKQEMMKRTISKKNTRA
jgi:DNA-damage-inducible protein J